MTLARAARGRLVLLAMTLSVAACGRLEHVGQPPALRPVGPPPTSARLTTEEVVRALPSPAPPPALPAQPGSLWQIGSQNFFNDNRASRVGDILTVLIDIDEEASFDNDTERTRDADEGLGTPNFFGLESRLGKLFPRAIDPDSLVKLNSSSATRGGGRSRRAEAVEMKMAVIITAILPNGNFVINGSQEVRVNFDLRELQIAGVVRPQDITAENTVTYDKIAEARIAYGGRGQLFDLQQPRYGQQVLDIVLPF
jgi:flagellar L-ring protein precursor FlgH